MKAKEPEKWDESRKYIEFVLEKAREKIDTENKLETRIEKLEIYLDDLEKEWERGGSLYLPFGETRVAIEDIKKMYRRLDKGLEAEALEKDEARNFVWFLLGNMREDPEFLEKTKKNGEKVDLYKVFSEKRKKSVDFKPN